MKVKDSVALVSGSSRGLGQALVNALLDAGAKKVYAAARDSKTITFSDTRVITISLDITQSASIAAAAERALDVTLLVNNAGVLSSGNVLTTSEADLDADFRTNVYGTLNLIKAFRPVLERALEGAAIVNISSLVALASLPALGGYSASKAAAYSMTQALRAELRSKRIEVLGALPALIDTDMVKHIPAPKTSVAVNARGIVEGIIRGDEEIFPEERSQQMAALWNKSHKDFERVFANL